jgi:hypothetical protein
MELWDRFRGQSYLERLEIADAIIDNEMAKNPHIKYTKEERFRLKIALLELLTHSNQQYGNMKMLTESINAIAFSIDETK